MDAAAVRKLPKIYETDIPDQITQAIEAGEKLIVVTAATGLGKTFSLIRILAHLSVIGHVLMPFRVAVREMWDYVSKFDSKIQYGYRMRGATQGDHKDDCTMFTVGYWLEYFIGLVKKNMLTKPLVVVVDEAHDASWQTDLALRILLWAQKMGAPIQIIISSATLDITDSIRQYNPKIFSVEDRKANINTEFLESPIDPIKKGKMTDELKKAGVERLIKIVRESASGDILCILPGETEISEVSEMFERNPLFTECAIVHLYSEMTKEEQDVAIQPDPQGRRKIILATNIVENAITIKGLMYMIDFGLRKINVIDRSGISQLVLGQISKANFKQASGRVGREGKRGTAYLLLSEEQHARLQAFSPNEVERNPLYLQIMKLLANGLPVMEILDHVSPYRINADIDELIKVGALEVDRKTVTRIGHIISVLPLSLQAGSFLGRVMTFTGSDGKGLDASYLYIMCVLASWIDLSTSMFLNPRRKPKETLDAYDARIEMIKEAQERFHGSDCLVTMLNIWMASKTEAKDSVSKWCYKNGIYDRSLKELFNNTKHCVDALGRLGIQVQEYKLTEKHIPSIRNVMVHFLNQTFTDRICTLVTDFRGDYYQRKGDYQVKHIRDKSIDYYDHPEAVMALGIRKHSGGKVAFISKLISIPKPKMDDSDDE